VLLIVAAVLAALWLLGVVAFHITAFAIHLLLIIAVVVVLAHFVTPAGPAPDRRSGRAPSLAQTTRMRPGDLTSSCSSAAWLVLLRAAATPARRSAGLLPSGPSLI